MVAEFDHYRAQALATIQAWRDAVAEGHTILGLSDWLVWRAQNGR